MAGPTNQPLSIVVAKTRLRKSAEEALPAAYIRRHPYTMLGIALSAGFLFGRNRLPANLFLLTMLKGVWSLNKFVR